MDDEKYFCFDGDNMPSIARFYTNDKEKYPDDVRFYGKEKFPKKKLMFIVISNRDLSRSLFRQIKYKFKYLYQRVLKSTTSPFYPQILKRL